MKIEQSDIGHDINKAMVQVQGNGNQLEDITSLVQRTEVKPRLITALLDAQANTETMSTDTYKYDETKASAALPGGKPYSGYGPDLTKDRPKTFRFAIPSFGQHFNVRPEDYAGRRKPGTANEFLTEADVLAAMSLKSDNSWGNFDELALAQLITTDTNIVRGGPFESFNFYTEIHGTTRPAAIDMDLGNGALDHIVLFRDQRKLQAQELARVMDSTSNQIVICGDNFFDKRYEIEKQETLARDLRSNFDFASQAIPTMSDGNFRYDNFTSHDGLTYINYGSEIIAGTKLVGDEDAYMIPIGAKTLLRKVHAPAQTRQYVNTQALEMYGWSTVDDRQGVSMWTESNTLYANVNPKSITFLTTTS